MSRQDLDQSYDPPTREQLNGEVAGVALAENGNPDHGPYVIFRAVCGARGYLCSARFRDHEAFGGGGATPREAMRSITGIRHHAFMWSRTRRDVEEALAHARATRGGVYLCCLERHNCDVTAAGPDDEPDCLVCAAECPHFDKVPREWYGRPECPGT
jgi:hypothetical protein